MAEKSSAVKPDDSPLRAVKGMNDILPPDSARWEWFEDTVRALMRRYGYLNVRTPIVEPTPLFVRGLGEVTVAAHQRPHGVFEPLPARRIGRQDVVHSYDGLDGFGHGGQANMG